MRISARRRPINLTLSSIGQDFRQPDMWSVPQILGSAPVGPRERIGEDFDDLVRRAYKGNGVVFTTMLIRQAILGEARFQFQRLENGRPGDLFGDPSLLLLEKPWTGATTGELIARMDQDGSIAGNFFATVRDGGPAGRTLRRLRPDWVTVVTSYPDGTSPWHLDAQPAGIIYQPPGIEPTIIPAAEVIHWSPIPDPTAQWRGMSWITAILREVDADNATSRHKLKFFENGATGGQVVTYDASVAPDKVKAHAELFAEHHRGWERAYQTIHLGGGADLKTVAADLKQLDCKVTQGAGESRIAAASLVGAVLAMFSEGMAGSALNAGNFNAAKRRFADVGARPLWRSMAAALAPAVDVPDGARLWYDDRDIPFLQDDARDAADILNVNAQAIAALARDGFEPDSAVAAITSGDLRLLEHTGRPSVQVQQE